MDEHVQHWLPELRRFQPALRSTTGLKQYTRPLSARQTAIHTDRYDFASVFSQVAKIRTLLSEGLRLRTACDFDVTDVRVTRPTGFELPSAATLAAELPALIKTVAATDAFSPAEALTITYRTK